MAMFDYVMSGCSHTRSTYPSCVASDAPPIISAILKRMQGLNGHTYSLLYNAFVEKHFGECFRKHYTGYHHIHADSGGLQIVTQGKEITEALKEQVYLNQSKSADISMSFDEIPVKIEGGKSNIHDLNQRFFDKENFEHYARLTGKNVKRQLEMFVEEKTKSKPLIILQGNNAEYYKRWCDYVLDEIPSELVPYIGGLSAAGAALGTGPLEDIERLYSIHEIEAPDNVMQQLHILGIGSVLRLMPAIIFKQNGLYDKDMLISYDSTSHSSGMTMGRFTAPGGKQMAYGKQLGPPMQLLHKCIQEYFGDLLPDYSLDFFCDALGKNTEGHAEKYGEGAMMTERHAIIFSVVMTSILNFTQGVEKVYTDPKYMQQVIGEKKKYSYFNSLKEVKNKQDFKHWFDSVGKYVPSQRVKHYENANTLEEFF